MLRNRSLCHPVRRGAQWLFAGVAAVPWGSAKFKQKCLGNHGEMPEAGVGYQDVVRYMMESVIRSFAGTIASNRHSCSVMPILGEIRINAIMLEKRAQFIKRYVVF